MTHYFLCGDFPLDLLIYVDDLLMLAESQNQVEAIGFAIYLMVLMGVPLGWDKFR